jgi:hypothetical protein
MARRNHRRKDEIMKISDRLTKPKASAPPLGFIGLLATAGNGQFLADVNRRLAQLVGELQEVVKMENRDAKGEMTVKIKWKTLRGAIAPTFSVTIKGPGDRPVEALYYGDEDGNVFQANPDAPAFEFAVTGSFDPATGEVRD